MIQIKLRAFVILAAASILTACTSPTREYSLQNPEPVQLGANSYKVYKHPALDRAEAHRVNFAFPPPSRLLILQQAQDAIRMTTGCDLKRGAIKGDQAIVVADLICP